MDLTVVVNSPTDDPIESRPLTGAIADAVAHDAAARDEQKKNHGIDLDVPELGQKRLRKYSRKVPLDERP